MKTTIEVKTTDGETETVALSGNPQDGVRCHRCDSTDMAAVFMAPEIMGSSSSHTGNSYKIFPINFPADLDEGSVAEGIKDWIRSWDRDQAPTFERVDSKC